MSSRADLSCVLWRPSSMSTELPLSVTTIMPVVRRIPVVVPSPLELRGTSRGTSVPPSQILLQFAKLMMLSSAEPSPLKYCGARPSSAEPSVDPPRSSSAGPPRSTSTELCASAELPTPSSAQPSVDLSCAELSVELPNATPSAELPRPSSAELSIKPSSAEPTGAEPSIEPPGPLSVGLGDEPSSAKPSVDLSCAELSVDPPNATPSAESSSAELSIELSSLSAPPPKIAS